MIIFKKFKDYSDYISKLELGDQLIGFVPTMGALHNGHLSLINSSKSETNLTVCSIFVNPTQFNNATDLQKYPITLEADIYLLESNQCDILILPDIDEVYPNNHKKINYNLGPIENMLEGKFRPGHFQGVCEVVDRLLTEVKPDILFLGQKDFQQCMIIQKLLVLTASPVKMQIIPTVRKKSGLALSSRNLRLSEDEKETGAKIYKALQLVQNSITIKNLSELKTEAIQYLNDAGFIVDYFETVAAYNLHSIDKWDKNIPAIALVAASINNVRLIDNILLS